MLEKGAKGHLSIYLHGRFRVEGALGEDLTPRGSKDCALLVLLVTSQHGERTRSWLQSKLWSDRGAEQAANSLRQAVAKLRKALGDYQSILLSNRQCVGIDLKKLKLAEDTHQEFLEGIEVRDEEFESWLAVERSSRSDRPAAPPKAASPYTHPPLTVSIQQGSNEADSTTSKWFKQTVSEMIARSLSENFDVAIMQQPPSILSTDPSPGTWCINLDIRSLSSNNFAVRISLLNAGDSQILWSTFRTLQATNGHITENEVVIDIVHELTTLFGSKLIQSMSEETLFTRADALCLLGVQRLFSMNSRQIDEADTLFKKAHEINPRGLYLAWRAHVREIQLVERVNADRPALKEQSEALVRRAFELEPNNSMVLALLSINRLHVGGQVDAALQYALRGVKLNYGNAMAWWALSAAHLKGDNPAKAYGCARKAVMLSQGTPIEFWTQSQLSGAAVAVRRLSEAKSIFQNVTFGTPDFRPPLRHLIALHATNEEWADAIAAAERLKTLEPGFSIDQLANDRDYPISLLHKPFGLDRERVLSLI